MARPLRIVHAAPYAEGSASGERHAGSILTLAHTVATRTLPDLPAVTERLPGPMPQALVDAGQRGAAARRRHERRQSAPRTCSRTPPPWRSAQRRSARWRSSVAAVTCPPTAPVVLGVEDVKADAQGGDRRLRRRRAPRDPSDGRARRARRDSTRGFHRAHQPDGALATDILDRLGPWRSRHPDVPVDVQVVSGAAAGHLLESSVRARLLVLGTRARGAAARVVLGSTSRTVLRLLVLPGRRGAPRRRPGRVDGVGAVGDSGAAGSRP